MTRLKFVQLSAISLSWLVCLPLVAQTDSSPAVTLASFENLIAELESGPQGASADSALTEAYYGFGIALHNLGRHEEAVTAFDSALQVVRENKGLYELQQ